MFLPMCVKICGRLLKCCYLEAFVKFRDTYILELTNALTSFDEAIATWDNFLSDIDGQVDERVGPHEKNSAGKFYLSKLLNLQKLQKTIFPHLACIAKQYSIWLMALHSIWSLFLLFSKFSPHFYCSL